MADSYRLSIFDQSGPDDIPENGEGKYKGKGPKGNANNFPNPASFNGQTPSKDDGSSTISLNSNTGAQGPAPYGGEGNLVTNNSDIFTERNANGYKGDDIDNEVNITGPAGDPYGKIVNVIADGFETGMFSEDASNYGKVGNVSQNNSEGAAQFLYGVLKGVVEDLSANRNNSSSGGGNGNGNDGDSNSYAENTKGAVTGGSSDGTFGTGIGINPAIPILNPNPVDPSNPTPVMENPVSELNPASPTDYSSTKDVFTTSISDTVDYGVDPVIDTKFGEQPMTEMEVITYPDAMSNMYDVYFRIRDDDTHDSRLLGKGQAFIKALFSSTLLSARISSIDIPAFQRKSGTINYASGVVERPLDSIDTPGRSSFSIRGDTKLAYISAFNELAGTDMSNLFGKGSAITKGLENSAAAKIQDDFEAKLDDILKEYKKVDDEYQKEWYKALEQDCQSIVEDFIDGKKAKFSDEDADKYEKYVEEQKEKYLKEHTDLSGFYTNLRSQMQFDTEKYIEDTKSKKNKESSGKEKAEGFFANLKEKREEKKKIQKEIDEYKEDLEKLYIYDHWNKRKECAQYYLTQLEALDKEKEELETKRKQDLKNLHFDKEGFNYITEALSKNISVISTPAKKDDLFNVLKTTKRLDIIVKRTTPSFKFRTKLTDKIDERFIFEDVKILGTSDSIKFERENAGPVDFTYDFIYKRFYKLDTYDEAGTWVTSQMSMFIDAAIDYALGKQTTMKRAEKWAKDRHQAYQSSVNQAGKDVSNAWNDMEKSFSGL